MISLIIPSRGESSALWATIVSAKEAFGPAPAGDRYEIIVVLDEPDGKYPGVASLMHQLDFCKVVFANTNGPVGARNRGAQEARGDFLIFADAHCIFPQDFFLTLLEAFSVNREFASVTAGTRFLDRTTYGCRIGWDDILWGSDLYFPSDENEIFPIASPGHGVFAIRADVFRAVGGYWKELRGWGGEEVQLNLKLWMCGYQIAMNPRTFHWHYSQPGARRGFEAWAERDFVRNFLLVAAAYGGKQQVLSSYAAFVQNYWKFEELHLDVLAEVEKSDAVKKEAEHVASFGVCRDITDLRILLQKEKAVH